MDSSEASRRALARCVATSPLDLARASLAIARAEYPDLDEDRCLAQLDELAARVLRSLPSGASQERRVGRLNTILFHELGFTGNTADYYDPRNSYLNEVLDRRTGIPISLSILYLEVGRRCGLQVTGVGFPGHFLCKVTLDEGQLIVDAFNRGQLLGMDDLKRRLAAVAGEKAPFEPRLLRSASPRDILLRVLQNLRSVYIEKHDPVRALSVVDRMLVLAPNHGRALRDRAGLYESLGGAAAAATDLERVLELEPRAPDATALRSRARKLRASGALLN